MAYLIILGVSVLILAFLFFRRKAASAIQFTPAARWLAWIGLFLLGVQAVFWFGMGIGEISGGVSGGVMHLIPGAALLLTLFLAWKIPLESGLILAFQGLALAVSTLVGTNESFSGLMAVLVFTALPPMLIGLLLLWACGLSLKKN